MSSVSGCGLSATRHSFPPIEGRAKWPGLQCGTIIRTGEGTYCLIGEWPGPEALAAARAAMIATLDTFRDTLEDLCNGLGVTDAVSGPVVLELTE